MYQFSRILSAKTSLFISPQDFDVIPFKALLALGTISVEVWSIFRTHNLKKPNRSRQQSKLYNFNHGVRVRSTTNQRKFYLKNSLFQSFAILQLCTILSYVLSLVERMPLFALKLEQKGNFKMQENYAFLNVSLFILSQSRISNTCIINILLLRQKQNRKFESKSSSQNLQFN